MKSVWALLFALCLTAEAQVGTYYAVTFYPTNSFEATNGMPKFQPRPPIRALGHTNGPLVGAEVAFDEAALNTMIATNRDGLNKYLQALPIPGITNLLAWQAIYNMMPIGIANCTAITNALWALQASITSTNTLAQLTAIVKQIAMDEYISFIYHRQIIDYLQRLGPGLQQIYDPTRDPTSP